MELNDFLAHLNSGEAVTGGSELHQFMHKVSNEAMKITAILNEGYHTPEEIRDLFSELIGKPVDDSFGLFPPFYSDCGKNITVGKNVFINPGDLVSASADCFYQFRVSLSGSRRHYDR